MDNSQSDLTKLNSAKWSTAYFTLPQLLSKFRLPQIVQINEGFYGETDDSTLCTGTILCLHSAKFIQKVHGRLDGGKGKKISISLDCERKVEVRPSNLKDVYENVEELMCSAFPKFVRVSKGYYCERTGEILVDFGDKLQFKKIDKSRVNSARYIFSNQQGQKVELSKDCVAGYQPLVDGIEYNLTDALRKFGMPLNVQFLASSPSIFRDAWSCDDPPSKPFQAIFLERISNDTVIIATTIRSDGNHDAMMTFDTEILFAICEDYTSISQIRSQGGNASSNDIYDDILPSALTSEDDTPRRRPNTRNSRPASSDLSAIHRENVPGSPCNDPSYTTLDPTYVSSQVYQELHAYQTVESSQNQQPPHVQNLPQHSNVTHVNMVPNHPPPTYTSLDPTYIFDRKYEMPIAVPHTRSSEDQQEKPQLHSFKHEVGLHTAPGNHPPPLKPKRTEMPNNKPKSPLRRENRLTMSSSKQSHSGLPKPESLLLPSDTETHDPHRIPERPTSIPDSHPTNHLSQQSAVAPEEGETIQAIAKYPLDLSTLTVADVGRLLKYLGMEEHVEIFKEELVDGSMLACMDKESFQLFDMDQFHAKKLLKFIEGWRPKV